jgi:hypothetical protein
MWSQYTWSMISLSITHIYDKQLFYVYNHITHDYNSIITYIHINPLYTQAYTMYKF